MFGVKYCGEISSRDVKKCPGAGCTIKKDGQGRLNLQHGICIKTGQAGVWVTGVLDREDDIEALGQGTL